MAIVYANIGSNLGNRKELIENALFQITEEFGICCLSSYIESDPWGFESGNRFLNLGISFKTLMDPEDVLKKLLKIEKSISFISHRNSDGSYKDREIDIDIMAIDDLIIEKENLKIPHPHLLDRDFFLIPLKQLQPEWQYPED